jgi:phosphotransferase system HPr (HPr) family protein
MRGYDTHALKPTTYLRLYDRYFSPNLRSRYALVAWTVKERFPSSRFELHAQKKSKSSTSSGCTRGRLRSFVRCVLRFKSKITICKGEENFSAASILEVLSADLDCGARVILEAAGLDEEEALNQLEALLLRFRDEENRTQGN